MNPEFRRQLWLQLSATQLLVLPALLLAGFAGVFVSAKEQPAYALALTGAALFALLVLGVGMRAVGASVMDELNDHTWDQQRMSAMEPWAMTWGKLAGASAYGWYGGALCLLVAVPAAWQTSLRASVLHLTLAAVLAGVFLQALLLAVNLQLARAGGRAARRGSSPTLVLVLLWGLGPVVSVLNVDEVRWWGLHWATLDFVVASLALFTLCALAAAWRSMAEMLAVRQYPWAWPALVLLTTTYLSGFVASHRTLAFGVTGLISSVVLTYFTLLTEPQPRPLWQRVVTRLASSQWQSALKQLPRWPATLVLMLPLSLLVMTSQDSQDALPGPAGSWLGVQPLCVLLLVVRDCALALFFAFSATGRRPVLAFWITLMVLHALLPWLLGLADDHLLLGLVVPLYAPAPLSVALALGHAAVAVGLLYRRWQATAVPEGPSQR
jgi:hypothetical protein